MEMDNGIANDNPQVERRHLTVLECDLVGSTALAHRLDPEKLRDLILSYQDSVLSWIKKMDGYFVQFAGDAVWAYFGYPKAHEDDAFRAIHAALGIIEAVREINIHKESLNVRIGIASGLCIVGNLRQGVMNPNVDTGDYVTAIGDPPNLAARLQTLVIPGAVAISDETRSLVGNQFEFEDIGFHALKGFSHKVKAWRALKPSDEQSRFQALRPNIQSPFIGRTKELAEIEKLWHMSCNHTGQVAYIWGEPGIGKSRLVTTVADNIVGSEYAHWWLHCSEHLQGSAFAPIITLIRSQAGIRNVDENSFFKLTSRYDYLDVEEHYFLAELLSIENTLNDNKTDLSPSKRREKIYEIITSILASECENRPLLLITEDFHWVDPTTTSFFQHLIYLLSDLPLLVLITSRNSKNCEPISLKLDYVHNLQIEQLPPDDSLTLLDSICNGIEVPNEITEQIISKTDGVPLFIEDLALSMSKSIKNPKDSAKSDLITVPGKLSDHLMSRIDNLGESKFLAQIASVVGREFKLPILKSLTKISTASLNENLSNLLESGLVEIVGHKDEKRYIFKHALIRDAAYKSLLIVKREELHGRIAHWLMNERPAPLDSQPEIIAQHYQSAGTFEQAINYYIKAGRRYNSRSNYYEASIHLNAAFELVSELMPSIHRDRIELDVITTLGAANAGAKGVSGENTGKIYKRARQLCKALDYPPEIFPILAGAGSFHFIRSDYGKSREIAEHSRQLAVEKSNSTGRLICNRILGAVHFVTGNFDKAIKTLQIAIDIYDEDPQFHRSFAPVYALDHKTTALCYLALANASIGNTDSAVKASKQAVEHSTTIDMHSTNCALCYQAALLHIIGSPTKEIARVSGKSLDLAIAEGYPSWEGMSRIIKGEADVQRDKAVDGMLEIEDGVFLHESLGAQTFLPLAKSIQAKGYMATKQYKKALAVLTEAKRLSVKTQEYWYLPEILRLIAETLFKLNDHDASVEGYKKALISANKISAVFWQYKIEDDMNSKNIYLTINSSGKIN